MSPDAPPSTVKQVTPAGPSIPGLEDADFRVKPAPMRREGTFLVGERGSLLTLPGGERAMVFHPNDQGKSERPMVLVPSSELQRMEQLAADRSGAVAFSVTGQVFSYRGVNYLLIPIGGSTLVRESGEPPAPPEPEAAAPHTSREPVGGGGTPGEPPVQDLIRRLEAQRDRPRTIEPGIPLTSGPGTPATPHGPNGDASPGAPQAESGSGVIPEGKVVVRRRARMVRDGGGQWSVVFHSGPKGEPEFDRPMQLVPCMNVQRMEAWAASRGDAVSLELSGMVLAYQGRNYLIPTLFRVDAVKELEPRQ